MSDESSGRHPDPVVVAGYSDRGEAEVTMAHLRANGIESFIVDEVGDTLPVGFEGGVYVVVHPQDADAARRVLGVDQAH
jgi:Putative prokaryotic signal transducing protein